METKYDDKHLQKGCLQSNWTWKLLSSEQMHELIVKWGNYPI